MRKKRLKHTTFTVCRIFCGWRLINSYTELNRLRTGVLKYDFLTQRSFFNDDLIQTPNILEEIEIFFSEELDRMSLTRTAFHLAFLKVEIIQILIESKNSKKFEKHTHKSNYLSYQYRFDCECRILTDEFEYIGKYECITGLPDSFR
ncbi:hypothetical protein LEP1GSC041_0344 [Leptospira noguchii str. 2006001870]|uniref:Uncharacterized protein n=1 Tax=Leptospira noguchii serovar Autumnalis str. ZUN142 TaxID=1085540 RepID=M6UUI2_9LEPT|nr:hypothetical protein [Leptospira noguchii]EKR73355.1 hypothetical protein LEP1GSC041_0344 [Leptospira noguchii str. 2006001870]EMO40928.1 hypothetical protein LEP1GSC186_3162 [Leptospira noguchii serovar Autumnalis str. ZUN142]